MRYVLCIKQPIYGAQGGYLAYQIAQALVEQGHQISQIFFFQQGTTTGNAFVYPANDEFNLQKAWQNFSQQYNVPLHLCIAAAQRRGIVDTQSAKTVGQTNLASHFVLAGLGEFSQALLESDRVLTL